jgi:choline-sulfatase
MRSAYVVREACRYMDEHKDDPFALWVSLQEPHSPFDFPVEDRDALDTRRFIAPRVGPEDSWQVPLIFRDLSDREKQGIIAAYYTSVRYLDRSIGKVLAHLQKLKLDDNTCVVYLADHGYSLGQHGRFEKHCGYDPALQVPLIIRYPGRVREGHKVPFMTEHIDVAPTICDLMGLAPMPVAHGESLRPYLEGRRPSTPRSHIVSQYLENEEAFVRTDLWKYIYCTGQRKRTDGYQTDNPTPGRYERLFDLQSDPNEFRDVSRAQPGVVRQMRDLHIARYNATHPEAAQAPRSRTGEDTLDFYLRPRDAKPA